MGWLMRFLRRPQPVDTSDDTLPPLFAPPPPDPKYERAVQQLNEIKARVRRTEYEFDGVTRRIHTDDHANHTTH